MRIRPYERLIVWQEAHKLCIEIYAVTKTFPREERYGLTSQMRRSSYSVPTNIAEGNGRRAQGERRHFVEIAMGSLEELHYQTLLTKALGYLTQTQLEHFDDHIQRVGYLLHKLHASLL